MTQTRRAPPAVAERAKRLRKRPSAAEALLWTELRKLKLGMSRQAPIGPYVVDFAHHASRLAIDLDRNERDTLAGAAKQVTRETWLEDAGYRVIRIPERDVHDRMPQVVERIAAETTPSPIPSPASGQGELDELA
jgi:very-short-patch-repair endonuclease